MGTISNKIEYLEGTKDAIRTAIESKGITVSDTDTFRSYATKIGQIDGGSSLTFDAIYPVGSIYMSVSTTSPSVLFGGTWEAVEGKFLLGTSKSYSLNSEGGEASHTLTLDELPNIESGTLQISSSAGSTPVTAPTGSAEDNVTVYELGGEMQPRWGSNLKVTIQGKDQPHNNMPPYLAVNIWKRTA